MGIPVLIMGESGSGKSASLRNFEPDEIGVFNVASKPLPFRKKLMTIENAGYQVILNELASPILKRYAIDDSQYLLAFEFMDHASEKGFEKFTIMAKNFYDLIVIARDYTPPDCIVYFLHHIETAYDNSGNRRLKAKTVGKLLDEKITVEGLFSIVLLCQSDNTNRHYFVTQSCGNSTAKSPMDMFPLETDNDLKLVDKTIREYYGMEV